MVIAVENDLAYFLHQTPYRDNSALAHLLTREHGKVSFIINGLKTGKHSKRAFLQPCRLLRIDYQLKSQLSKLTEMDFADELAPPSISQFMLYQYVNELLLTALPVQLPVPTVFDDCTQFLALLSQSRPHAALRYMELSLLILSAGLPDVGHTQDTHATINAEQTYYFYPEQGVFAQPHNNRRGVCLRGAQLQAFAYVSEAYVYGRFNAVSEPLAQGAKPLMTALIQQLLGGKKLKTRDVYRALQTYSGIV